MTSFVRWVESERMPPWPRTPGAAGGGLPCAQLKTMWKTVITTGIHRQSVDGWSMFVGVGDRMILENA